MDHADLAAHIRVRRKDSTNGVRLAISLLRISGGELCCCS